MLTASFPVDVFVTPAGQWGFLPFWTRFMVSLVQKDPGVPWDGSGPPFGGPGETEDWKVIGDPGLLPPEVLKGLLEKEQQKGEPIP